MCLVARAILSNPPEKKNVSKKKETPKMRSVV